MAIEIHHLNTHGIMEQTFNVLDGVVRLKARIAELEALNHNLCERVTENDEIRLHWEEIEQTKAENERMKARIAKLEERIADGDKDFEMATSQNERLLKIVLHHKYKRCLATANWCAAECVVNQNTYKKYFTHKSEFRIEHFRKWYFRLLKLAEKFKEAK